ncbi:TPA: tetratricopeptide repeat protein [Candidatus Poribacteria bacterium]|nr:tetratricopeptide repeat protein [Candidatus Poribacteria bacterium]HIN32268.1 tetratricopeptide repeat protein [Candidatus Poribacteria bacterium]
MRKQEHVLEQKMEKIMKIPKLVMVMVVAFVILYGCLSTSGGLGQAEKFIAEKDYQGAVDTYNEIIQSQLSSDQGRKAQLGLAKLYIEKMDLPEQGIEIYQNLTEAAPESPEAAEAHYKCGICNYKAEKYGEAAKSFNVVINKFPNLEWANNAQLMLAKSYEKAQNFEKAAEIYDNFANRNPKNERAATALINKARIERNYLKNTEEATNTYQRVVRKYGLLEEASNQLSEATKELEALGAVVPEPDNPLASRAGRALQKQRDRLERDRPRNTSGRSPAMGNVRELVQNSGFGVSAGEVMSTFGSIQTDEQGTFHDAMLMIANMTYQEENYRDAGALYFRAISLAKADDAKIDPYSHVKLSICYRKLGMHTRADEVLQQALRKDREVLDVIIRSGQSQYINEEYEKAAETYKSVLGFNRKKDPEIYWKLSLIHKKTKEPEKEMEYLERAIVGDMEYVDALQSLAEVLHYRLGNTERAGFYQDLVDGKGNTYEVQRELGNLCYKYASYSRAKTKYRIAARNVMRELEKVKGEAEKRSLTNLYLESLVHVSMSDYKFGKEEEAVKTIEGLAEDYPDHALIDYGRGQVALLKEDTEAAIGLFNSSIEKDPRSDAAPTVLGNYYMSVDKTNEAIAVWEHFLQNNRYHKKLRKRLNQAKKLVE